MLEESFTLSLRSGDWKYIEPFAGNTPDWLANKTAIKNGLEGTPQLFDLSKDQFEVTNVASKYPEVVTRLQARLDAIKNLK